jgi:hypothetical protein
VSEHDDYVGLFSCFGNDALSRLYRIDKPPPGRGWRVRFGQPYKGYAYGLLIRGNFADDEGMQRGEL